MKITLGLCVSAILVTIIGVYLLKPIPQLETYHHFADQRNWFGIPNIWNVLSNSAIALPGIWGLFLLLTPNKILFYDYRERWLWLGVSLGLILTAIGSTHYHLAPENSRLIWDRMPMAFTFMSLVAALIGERINILLGLCLWPILLGVGFYSVWIWYASELNGVSDLSFYIGIQVFTFLMIAIMLLTPSRYTQKWLLAAVLISYGLAVLCDTYDHQINMIFNGVISGHTIKHVAVGLAGAFLIGMIGTRKRGDL
jgi:hypothetical protein